MFQKFESFSMSKPAIVRVFKAAIAFVVAGGVVGTAVTIWALANGAIALGGPTFITIDPGTVAGALVGFAIASLLAGAGAAAAFVSWAGALINTSRLDDKTWFGTLLVLGLVSLGWLAMFAYVLKGPDSMTSPHGEQPSAA